MGFLNASTSPLLVLWTESALYILLYLSVSEFIRFADAFPDSHKQTRGKHRRIRQILNLILVLSLIFLALFYYMTFSGSPGKIPFFTIYPIFIFLMSLWAIFIFFRKAIMFDRRTQTQRSVLSILLNPESSESRGCRAFGLLIFIPLTALLIVTMGKTGLLPVTLINVVFPFSILLFNFNFALSYINHFPGPGTFMIKLTGASLVIVLGFLGSVGYLVSPSWNRSYRYPYMISDSKTIVFSPRSRHSGFNITGYDIRTVLSRFDGNFNNATKLKPGQHRHGSRLNKILFSLCRTFTRVLLHSQKRDGNVWPPTRV